MKLGYNPATAYILDLEQGFRLAGALQLDFIELSYELYEVAPESQRPAQVRELVAATGVETTVHLPFTDLNLASIVPRAREVAVERVARSMDYAASIGAGCAVLHTGQNNFFQPVTRQYAREALASSLQELSGSDVTVALENLAVSPFDLLSGPDELRKVTREAGMVNCLDFGHAHLEACMSARQSGELRDLIGAYLDALGDDVVHLHVHGNNGLADEHRATCDGNVPFESHASFLAGFTGTICIEVSGGSDGVSRSADHLRELVSAVR